MALVNQEQVGIIFAYDVTRLARNCTDWYQLLDLCGYRCCLVGDQDGIYDPATPNGRLILGLKGLISELELHTLRARLTAGLLNKARRGELALSLPIGLVRDALGRVLKHPDQEVQDRLELVFTTFLRVKAACRVVQLFNDRDLLLPRRDRFGDLVWRRPTASAILSILKNPAYAGAFVYGRTRAVPRADAPHQRVQKPLPMDQWKVCLRDKYPAYIGWDTFERIQAMVRDNYSEYDRNKTRGVPRPGKALLHGIVYCGECGHKMVVQYKSGTHYICNYLRQQYRVPVCQNLPADPIDAHVVGAFLDALSPVELDLYGKAVAALRQGRRSRCGRRSGSRSSGSATRPAWPSGSTTRPTRTTAWWPPSWRGVGRRRCGNSRTPRSGSGTSSSNPEPLRGSVPRNEKPSSRPARRSRSYGVRTACRRSRRRLSSAASSTRWSSTAPPRTPCKSASSGGVATPRPRHCR